MESVKFLAKALGAVILYSGALFALIFIASFALNGFKLSSSGPQPASTTSLTPQEKCRETLREHYYCDEEGKSQMLPTHPYYSESASTAPECNIKGNISFETSEKIYHVPGQYYYDTTVINAEFGERMFCSEQDAINAGWRKSYE